MTTTLPATDICSQKIKYYKYKLFVLSALCWLSVQRYIWVLLHGSSAMSTFYGFFTFPYVSALFRHKSTGRSSAPCYTDSQLGSIIVYNSLLSTA